MKVDADIVIAVPDSGTTAALGFAEESGIRFEEGLIKTGILVAPLFSPARRCAT